MSLFDVQEGNCSINDFSIDSVSLPRLTRRMNDEARIWVPRPLFLGPLEQTRSTVSDAKSVEKAGLTRSNDPKLDRWVFYNS